MAAVWLLAALGIGSLWADSCGARGAPVYSASSIANSAAGVADFYAPNTFISIYGQNLSRVTRALSADDISAGTLPTALPGTGVRVLINNIAADVFYVSPALVNVLVPTLLVASPAILQLESDGVAGCPASIVLGATAPAIFQVDPTTVLAFHADWSLISASAPAHPGEIIILYATGLGPTLPAQIPHQLDRAAAQIAQRGAFQVFLNGQPVDSSRIQYAGAAPGYAGVYQINLQLPGDAPPNPEIRISTSDRTSPEGRTLLVQVP